MSNIAEIRKVESITGRSVDEVIKGLRELLAAAERGEIKSVLWFADRFDQTFDVGWTGCDDMVMLSGQIARLQHRVQRRMDEARE
jgi:hypothetical protein